MHWAFFEIRYTLAHSRSSEQELTIPWPLGRREENACHNTWVKTTTLRTGCAKNNTSRRTKPLIMEPAPSGVQHKTSGIVSEQLVTCTFKWYMPNWVQLKNSTGLVTKQRHEQLLPSHAPSVGSQTPHSYWTLGRCHRVLWTRVSLAVGLQAWEPWQPSWQPFSSLWSQKAACHAESHDGQRHQRYFVNRTNQVRRRGIKDTEQS